MSNPGRILAALMVAGTLVLAAGWQPSRAGELPHASGYKVLAPITHGRLTIFPVVTANTHDTSQFITLDEGIRSGEVIVTKRAG